MKKILIAIAALSILGVATAGYGLVQHYGPIGSGFCNWGGKISCDIVNKSAFSEIAGVPVALVGLLGYITILGTALWTWRTENKNGAKTLVLLAAGGMAFSLYLTWIEFYWLRAYCPICITSQTLITAILILSLFLLRKPSPPPALK